MRLCELNRTIISYDVKMDHIITVKKNRIVGVMGSCIDNILCSVEKRICKIIGASHLGSKLDNGTYTGALGLLQSGKGDVYLKGEPEVLINEPFFIYTILTFINYFLHKARGLPLRAEQVWATQKIHEEEKDFSYFDLLENFKFSLEIYLIFFATLISFGLICFGLFRLKMRSNDNYLNKNLLSKFVYILNYLTDCNEYSFKSILLFFGLFIWFVLEFLGNVIQTNTVVVDTSSLAKNKKELINYRLVCFFKDDTAYNLAVESPKNSFLFKLFNEKTKLDDKEHRKEKQIFKNTRCLIPGKRLPDTELLNLKLMLVYTEIETLGVAIFMSQFNLVKKIWALKNVHEYNVVIFFRPIKEDKYRLMNDKLAYQDFEYGLSQKLYNCIIDGCNSLIRKGTKIYGDINEYIDDYTGFSNLEFNNFRSLFIIYFSFLIFIFVVFFFFQIVPFYYSKIFGPIII